PLQMQEVVCGGRYLAGSDSVLVFAAGSLTNRMRIEVHWRSGNASVVDGVEANRIYEVEEAGARPITHPQSPITHPPPLFEDASQLIGHAHHEEEFNDFERQPLLPRKLSQLGPGVAWGDIDGDGWEDLIVGSGKGGRLAVFRNDGQGGFNQMTGVPFDSPLTRDLAGIIVWQRTLEQAIVFAGSA